MNVRPVLAVVALLVAAPHADAAPAPKKVCKVVTDDKGDVYVLRAAPTATAPDDALDIVSADIATNKQTVTVVIRVAKYTLPPTTSPTGSTYEMQFNVTGASDLFYLNGSQSPGVGANFDAGYRTNLPAVTSTATSLGTPTGTFDTAKNEIRISAPLSIFESRAKFKAGSKITAITVLVGRGGKGRGVFADEAAAAKPYVIGTPSCVAVGK